MTDRELEQRLRAWYEAEIGSTEAAPVGLRESVATIPATTPAPLRPLSGRRRVTLLAVAALIVVGGALAAGSGFLIVTPVVTPAPSPAAIAPGSPSPAETRLESPSPTAQLHDGTAIAFMRNVNKARDCFRKPNCPTPRLWVVGTDGHAPHELLADGVGSQTLLAWSPDGARLLYSDETKLFLTDPDGGRPQPVDTGCSPPSPTTPLSCQYDAEVAFSSDGRSIVFARNSTDATGAMGPAAIATMDLASGRVSILNATADVGAVHPGWSPDGRQIVFFRPGDKDSGGPDPVAKDAVFVIDADGQNLHQISAPSLAARFAEWSPDGARIVFTSANGEQQDIYTMRPDGSDVRRLTTDGLSTSATWMPDGWILFTRLAGGAGSAAAGWWTMDADGARAILMVSRAQVGVSPEELAFTYPAMQSMGGPAIVPPPWTPATATTVGPPAPTPSPTPTPDLAPGFSWTGSATAGDGTPFGDTATRLADGRVLVTAGCSKEAALYDPSSGTFSPTGSMSAVRSSETATLLHDGRVLVAGGYNCAAAGADGTWASAELYDPTTGTFSPTGSMAAPRQQHTATLLADGRVLIVGGLSGPGPATAGGAILASYRTAETDAFLATAEIYDPVTGTFSRTGSMSTPHRGHTATLLQDGRVLVVGNGGESSPSSRAADLYDPATGRFSKTGPMKTGRWLHTATLLQDGRVLILGGRSPKDSVYTGAEMYDPRSGTFSSVAGMREGRQQHTATLLPDGRVLIAGGYWSDGQKWRVLSSTEMYDPGTGKYTTIGSMGARRSSHTATLLNDGRVLIVGGEDIGNGGGVGVPSAVLYQP
jgi:WD40 repeat protein